MKNTKTKATLIGCSLLMIISCDPKEKSADKEILTSNLENYVDSIETAVRVNLEHNWNEIDRRYKNMKSEADKAYDLSDDKSRLEQLESRYQEIIDSGKRNFDKIKNNSEMHMERLEKWWNNATVEAKTAAKNSGESLESGVKESMEWLEENFEKLGENIKTRYQKIKNELKNENEG